MCIGKYNENLSGKEFRGLIACYELNVCPPLNGTAS